MNYIDFFSNPDGFPLEADATLGAMQTDYQDAIRALAKLAGSDTVILTGVEVSGTQVSPGWILLNGDLVYFQGGTKSDYFILQETVTHKANQAGDLIDAYTVKSAVFGTGSTQHAFTTLDRINNLQDTKTLIHMLAQGGQFDKSWVIVNGFATSANSGTVIYRGRILSVVPYSGHTVTEVSPVYLTADGEWTTVSSASHLKFDPYSTQHMEDLVRRKTFANGSIVWMVDAEVPADRFPSGLGKWEWKGFAIADGNNGTIDLSSAIAGVTAIQRI